MVSVFNQIEKLVKTMIYHVSICIVDVLRRGWGDMRYKKKWNESTELGDSPAQVDYQMVNICVTHHFPHRMDPDFPGLGIDPQKNIPNVCSFGKSP